MENGNKPKLSRPLSSSSTASGLAHGLKTIKTAVKTLPGKPGIYQMKNAKGTVLYVGKAKNLKKRVLSYSRPTGLNNRIARMVAQVTAVEIVTTHTEADALLLEANLIKTLKPRYNVLLRDDKSFPNILLRIKAKWPQIKKHRGSKREKGSYFGPFASAGAVNRTLNTLQRVFLLRSCSDSVLESRTRPCLLYQIKRCSGPCVGLISEGDYADLVSEAASFLAGRKSDIQKRLSRDMQKASDSQEFERAAALRDRLQALTQVQAHQYVNPRTVGNADIIAIHQDAGRSSVQVFFFRAGQNWGNRSYFPRHEKGEEASEVLGAFIAQFYDNKPPPPLILVNQTPKSKTLLEEALSSRADHLVKIHKPVRGEKTGLIREALTNAKGALSRKLAESSSQMKLLIGLADKLNLDAPPVRIEVYDNSHVSGTDAVGAMIVSGPEGFQKNAYRKFNIKDKSLSMGDDYGMMREVLTRRFSRLVKEDPDRESENWPDLLIIDGGAGQLSVVSEVLTEVGLEAMAVVAISKGKDRNSGREFLHMPGRTAFQLEHNSQVLYFLQRLRDEAHRFAIGVHRAKRSKRLYRSALDAVPGIGPKRKRALLHHFGSARAVEQAGLKDLEVVSGISKTIARIIYDYFHSDS